MKKLVASITVLAIGVVAPIAVSLAQDGPIPIHVEATVEQGDHVGSQLVYLYKEHIRRSAGMDLRSAADDALVSVKLVTMDPTDTSETTVYSAVLTMRDLLLLDHGVWWYVTSSVGICGENTEQCANRLISSTDAALDKVREFMTEIAKAARE